MSDFSNKARRFASLRASRSLSVDKAIAESVSVGLEAPRRASLVVALRELLGGRAAGGEQGE